MKKRIQRLFPPAFLSVVAALGVAIWLMSSHSLPDRSYESKDAALSAIAARIGVTDLLTSVMLIEAMAFVVMLLGVVVIIFHWRLK